MAEIENLELRIAELEGKLREKDRELADTKIKLHAARNKLKRVEKKLKSAEKENITFESANTLRAQLEAVEFEIKLISCIPVRDDVMIRRLRRDGHEVSVEACSHFVLWLYFLQYSSLPFCEQIRGILQREGISFFTFSTLVARIHAETSDRIHVPLKPVNLSELMEGSKLFEMDDERLLDCVSVLYEIKQLRLRWNQRRRAFLSEAE